jgi:dienelactone hydrolase
MMKKLMPIQLMLFLIGLSTFAQLQPIGYKDGEQKLNGFALQPVKERRFKPGILILPAWKGIDDHSKESATKLAALGYYTFIADIYGEGNYPNDASEAGQQAGKYKKDYVAYQKRIQLALKQLVQTGADPNNIVVMGYCFGGTGALEAARGEMAVKGVVSFHGGLNKDTTRPSLPMAAKVLVLHGADDPYVPAAEIAAFQQEMRDANADWQMVYYANAVHAFTDPYAGSDNSTGAAFNGVASKRSWEHFLLFLKEILK